MNACRSAACCTADRTTCACSTLVLAGSSHADTGKALGMTTREVELVVGYIEELLVALRFNNAPRA